MKKIVKILLWTAALFIVIQVIPINRENPPVNDKANFIDVMKTPKNVQQILKNSCYDCHSFETKYPSYAYVAPLSWSVKNHVNEGREHFNFSKWISYNNDLKKRILTKAIREIDEGKMPLPAYMVYHEDARLNAAEKKQLTDYFRKILSELEEQ